MSKSLRWGVAMATAFALVLTACGGGSSSKESAEGSSSGGNASESSSSGSSSNDELDLGDVFSGDFERCAGLAGAVASVGILGLSNSFGGAEIDRDEVNDAVSELEQYVPDELEGEFNTIRDGLTSGADLADPEIESAYESINAYLEETCAEFGGN